MKGFVYSGILETSALEVLQEQLGLPARLSWDPSRLDFSRELREEGTAFGFRCELRWHLCAKGMYRVLLLADEEIPGTSLQPVEGPWEVEEREIRLIDLREARFTPQFQVYPGIDAPVGKLRCRVFSKGGITMFVSPREVQSHAPAKS